MRRTANGSILIEHLIAIVITAILTAAAVPGYSAYLRRGWIVDATTALATYSGRLEASFDSSGNYGVLTCAVAAPATTDQWSYGCALQSSGQSFLVTATGRNAMTGYAFTLDEMNNRATTAFPSVSGARSCWLLQGTEC